MKCIKLILFTLVLGTITFYGLILFLVDSTIIKDFSLLWRYLGRIQETYPVYLMSYTPFIMIAVLTVLVDFIRKEDDYGDAQFASNYEIARMHDKGLYESEGTILALKDNRYIRTNASLSTLIVAPQGTGKTAGMIIPSLLSDRSSALINDIKGELWDKTSLQRSHFGRVGIFAPSQHLKGAFRWNPLDKKCLPEHFDDQIDFVERIGSILYPTEQDGMDATAKHFNAEAKSIFTYWAMFLIFKNGGTSLPDVYMTALESEDMQAAIACDLDEFGEQWHPILVTIANSILGKGGNEYQGTVTTFKQALEPFSRPNIARNLRDCDFTHLDFKEEKPLSLYLFIPANDVSRMAPIVRILVEYLVNEFLSITDQEIIKRQRVVFFMDEFPRMGYMKALKEAPALQRSYNMATVFVAQDKNQLETTYGKGSFDQFITTTDFKVIFRQNEDTTAARFSTLVGKTTRNKKSVSKKDLELLGSTSENKEGVPLILPQDFMNQKKNNVFILASGNHSRPIKAKCAWWFKDRYMRKLVGAFNGMTVSDLSLFHSNAENDNIETASNLTNETDIGDKTDSKIADLQNIEHSDLLVAEDAANKIDLNDQTDENTDNPLYDSPFNSTDSDEEEKEDSLTPQNNNKNEPVDELNF